jgi:hypothetical protein
MNVQVKVSVKDETNFLGRTTNQEVHRRGTGLLFITHAQHTCALPYDRNAFQGSSKLLFKEALLLLQDIGVVMSQKRR